ncbi:uncharacterized protein [Amphiura filiformis]|uniref:uncharacterized protein isoform X2 n=1 Tax=Amphiura filiformis TaxID=82378 RepID=UPI003B219A21
MNSALNLCVVLAVVVLPSAVFGCSCGAPRRHSRINPDGTIVDQSELEAFVCRSSDAILRVKVLGDANNGDDYEIRVKKVFRGPEDLLKKTMILKADRNSPVSCGLSSLQTSKQYYLEAYYDESANTLSAGLCNYNNAVNNPDDMVTDEDAEAAVVSTWCTETNGDVGTPGESVEKDVSGGNRGNAQFREYQKCLRQAFQQKRRILDG